MGWLGRYLDNIFVEHLGGASNTRRHFLELIAMAVKPAQELTLTWTCTTEIDRTRL